MTRASLAALYRHAKLVAILTSEREGFGFPAVEALAAGAPVVLTDIPGFREAAGDAAVFCALGEVGAFVHAARSLLDRSQAPPSASVRTAQARRFSWSAHGNRIAEAYARALETK